MTFIVEDGTGLPDSNAYTTVESADAYFASRGNTEWAALDPEAKAVAIVQATDYIDFRWGAWLMSVPLKDTQALQFPRKQWPGIPTNILKATAEYALRASAGPLAPDLSRDESGLQVLSTDEKVGPIQEKKTFAAQVSGIGFQMYPAADALMRPFLGANGMGRVIRNG